MKTDKSQRCEKLNSSVKSKPHQFAVGDWVYVRNRVRNKFDPLYLEEPWIIESIGKNGVIVHNAQLTKEKTRHVDDIKPYIKKNLVKKTSQGNTAITTPKVFVSLPSTDVQNTSPQGVDAHVHVHEDEGVQEQPALLTEEPPALPADEQLAQPVEEQLVPLAEEEHLHTTPRRSHREGKKTKDTKYKDFTT